MNALIVITVLIVFILLLAYVIIFNIKFRYWKSKNVPYLKPSTFFGNYGKFILLQQYPGILIQKLCENFRDHPYFGAYYGTEPVLIVQSPELIKHVFTKDFYYFHGREITKYVSKEIVTQNLFFSGGDKWKVVRQNLTPLFSSAQMRSKFQFIEKCSHTFEDMLEYENSTSDVLGAKDICARYTMDCICSSAFGVEAKSMGQDPKNPFRFMAQELFINTNIRGLKIIFRAIWPAIFYGLGLKIFPQSIDKFFSQLLNGVLKSRNYKPSPRNDFVDLVMNLKEEGYWTGDSISNLKTGFGNKVKVKVDDESLVAQCIVFFAAGFETSSTTLAFTLFELAKNPEVQKRAAVEVDEFLERHSNKLNYECVNELTFVDACVYETLRKYPVLSYLTREVMEDYVLPTGLKVEKGVRIHIPVYHMHHSPDYFPDPHRYNPDRFMPENKKDLQPYTFFPYGEGPRSCIGKRFSKMQVMAGLITFLKMYTLELADDMPDTVEFDARTWLLHPKDTELRLKLTRREGWESRCFNRE